MADSFLNITSSTASVHSYSALALLDNPSVGTSATRGVSDVDTDEEQMRLFKNGTELVRPGLAGAEYSVDDTAKDITLTSALISADRLLIVRQTRRDRPYVTFTNSALLKMDVDINLYVDQLIFTIQELNEEPEIQTILDGSTYPDGGDKSAFTVTITDDETDGPFDYSSISLIRNDRVNHEDQLTVIKNGTTLVLTTAYTVDAANQEVDLVSALISSDTLIIRRLTSTTRLIPDLPNASSFSSDMLSVQFEQLTNLIQELPSNFGLDSVAIRNYRNPRRKLFVTYSGPGDRFFYGNLPNYVDGQVFVWRDDSLLTEDTDYHNDDWAWLIDLIASLLATETITIMVVPLCPFPILFCNTHGDWGLFDPGNPLGPDDTDGVPTNPERTGTAVETGADHEVDIQQGVPDGLLTLDFSVFQTASNSGGSARWPNFEFDVSGIDVASASTVTLRLVTASNPTQDKILLMRRILRTDWDIDNLTWNQYDQVNAKNWTTGGGQGAGTDFESGTQVSWTFSSAVGDDEAVISPNIKSMITAAQAGDGILRVQLADHSINASGNNYHGVSASTVNFRPRLIVTN